MVFLRVIIFRIKRLAKGLPLRGCKDGDKWEIKKGGAGLGAWSMGRGAWGKEQGSTLNPSTNQSFNP
jgi:hypothetical protein